MALAWTRRSRPAESSGLQTAAAEMDLHNAELALRRARSDLATQVRNAYFAVLVAKETVRVNAALAHFTDEVYRLQADLLAGGFAAPYEPAALRAQAYTARLAYKQAIQTYIYSWKQLVAAINVRQLPLSEVAGRVDSAIPYYDFDAILAYVLRNHTDVLTARNGIDKARYNLKLAQVTPVPDVDVNMAVLKDYSLAPKQACPTLTLGVPLPVWDRNKGAIMAAESALVRAEEEPHRVEHEPDQYAGRRVHELQEQPGGAGVLSPVHPARPGAGLSRRLRSPSDRPQCVVRRRGQRPANAGGQRDDLFADPRPGLDLGDERGRPDPDRRPVRVRQARGRAAAARPGTVDAAALLSSLRSTAWREQSRCPPDGAVPALSHSRRLSPSSVRFQWSGSPDRQSGRMRNRYGPFDVF